MNQICILIHLSNLNDFDDMLNVCKDIKNADIFMGVSYGWKNTFNEALDFICENQRKFPSVNFYLSENILVDSGSFLQGLKNISDYDYQYIIKIHNKTNLPERKKALQFLEHLDKIIEIMDENENIGMIGSQVETLSLESRWNLINEPDTDYYRKILCIEKSKEYFSEKDYLLYNPDLNGINLKDHWNKHGKQELRAISLETGSFIPITMFICRVSDIKKFFTNDHIDKILSYVRDDIFISGENLTSGQGHALERIYGNIFINWKYVMSVKSIMI